MAKCLAKGVTKNKHQFGLQVLDLSPTQLIDFLQFGYGGANAHAVLEDASRLTQRNDPELPSPEDWLHILPFSARTREGLSKRVISLSQMDHTGYGLTDLVYTLGCRRSMLSHRGFLLARQSSLTENLQVSNLTTDTHKMAGQQALPIAMVFAGQGAQWPRMGLELYEKNAFYRYRIQSLDEHLHSLDESPSWTIAQTLYASAEEGTINLPSRSQTTCTALQIALFDLFRTWCVYAQAVVGHSSGEIAAAYAAGHITSNEAIAIAYYRGLAGSSQICSRRGAMMAVGLGEQECNAEIESVGVGRCVRVACNKSPQSSTVSGPEDEIEKLHKRFQSRKAFARKLHTSGIAYHSYDIAGCGPFYESHLSKYLRSPQKPCLNAAAPRMISSLTGKVINAEETRCAAYWRANMESPVEFASAISNIFEESEYHFLEIGPHSTLELPIKQIYAQKKGRLQHPFLYTSTMTRKKNSIETSLQATGQLFISGHAIDFGRVNTIPQEDGSIPITAPGKVLTDLPTYPWQHKEILWNESRSSTEYRFRKYARHELLGSIVPGGNPEVSLWRNLLKVKDVSWLADHRLEDRCIFPAAGYLAMAMEAVSHRSGYLSSNVRFSFRAVYFKNALVLPSNHNEAVEILTEICPCKISQANESDTWSQFEVNSWKDSSSTTHAKGMVCASEVERIESDMNIGDIDNTLEPANVKRWYSRLATKGLRYGPQFQRIRSLQTHRGRCQNVSKAEVQATEHQADLTLQSTKYAIHPATLDALLQTGLIADSNGLLSQLRAGLPVSIESLQIVTPSQESLGEPLSVRAQGSRLGTATIAFGFELHDVKNKVVASAKGIRMAEYTAARSNTGTQNEMPVLDLIWKPEVNHLQPSTFGHFVEYARTMKSLSRAKDLTENIRIAVALFDSIKHRNPLSRLLHVHGSFQNEDTFREIVHEVADYENWHQQIGWFTLGKVHGHELNVIKQEVGEESHLGSTSLSDEDRFDLIVFDKVGKPCQLHKVELAEAD